MSIMISHQLSTAQLPRLLRSCIYAVLLGAFFGVVSDTRAQSKEAVCAALDMNPAECALITRVSSIPSPGSVRVRIFGSSLRESNPWIVDSGESIQGATSMRSADIGDRQSSCLVLTVTLPAGSLISFSLRTDSQAVQDRLAFFTTNQSFIEEFTAQVFRTTLRDWEPQTVTLPVRVSNLSWCYIKGLSGEDGEDSGWLDNLSLSFIDEVCSALDLSTEDCALITGATTTLPSGLTFPQEGSFSTLPTDIPWLVSTVRTEGGTSLRSGAVDHRQGSCLVLQVSLPANTRVRFSLRTSSEGRFDRLAFFADNRTVISNFSSPEGDFDNFIKDWTVQEHRLTGNASNLTWCYLKNGGTFIQGDDSGWLDALSFIRVCPALDMSAEACDLITDVSYDPPGSPWTVNDFATEGRDSLHSTPVTHNQQSCLILNVSLPGRTLVQFSRRVDSQPADELYFSVDGVRQEYSLRPAPSAVLRDWSREVHILFESGNRTLRWCYVKDARDTEGEDRAWIDNLSLVAPPAAPLNRELVCLVLDMSLEDCELITTAASEPASPAWYISYFNSEGDFNNRKTSLRSDPAVNDDETSCLVLGVALPGDRNLSFTLRSDSEAVNDFVYFEADGVRLVDTFSAAPGSSVRAFEEVNVLLSGSVRTLKWCYTKNSANSVGADSGWVDDLSFNAVDLAAIALSRTLVCQALDLSTEHCALINSVAAAPPTMPWVLSPIATEGGLSLRSAPINDDQTSCLVLGITLPDDRSLRFSLRTDSEAVNDFVYFEADGIRLVDAFTTGAQNSSVRDWEPLDVLIAGSVSNLTWCYTKNGSTSAGEDSGWLDALTFTVPGLAKDQLCTALDMNTADCALITSISTILPPALVLAQQSVDVPWSVASDVSHQGDSALRSGDIDHSEASCLVLGVVLPEGTLIRFALLADAEGSFDHLTFAADSLTVIERFSLPRRATSTPTDFELQEYTTGVLNPVSNLSWCYQKNADTDMFGDRVWLDTLSFAVPVLLSRTQICAALDLSTDNCSQIQSVSFDPLSFPWLITTNTYVAGRTSLRSGDIGDSEQSCLVLKLALPAGSVISVAGRTSSEGRFDQLLIDADNLRLDTISAAEDQEERDWRQQNYFLPTAISTLSWCYAKDLSESNGQDAAWIDNLSFSASNIPYQSHICAALDVTENNCALIQSITYNPPELLWVVTSQTSVVGRTSLRSGDIDGNQSHCLVLGITLPAGSMISVAGRTSSQGGFDQLQIFADPLRLDTLSAAATQVERDWRQESYFLPTAISTLSWCYTKDDSTNSGQDAVWIDNLSFSTSDIPYQSRICSALDVTENNCSLIQSITYNPPELLWVITSQTSVAGRTSLRSGDIDHNQSSCIVLGLPLPANSVISVAGRTSSQGSIDRLLIDADQLRLETISAPVLQANTIEPRESLIERDWRQHSYFLPTAISTLSWCYTKDGTVSSGQDAAWIDNLSFGTSNIPYQSRICAVLDVTENNCSLIQSITHNPPESLWVITSQTSVAGRTSLRSGDIDGNQSSCIVLGLALPANSVISVAGRTSSRGRLDQLLIDADSLRLDTISAANNLIERGWRQQSYFLPTAISTLSWCYTKVGFKNSGQDVVWIDNLSFSTSDIPYQSRICAALDVTENNCSLIQSVSYEPPELLWLITSATSVAGRTSLRSGAIGDGQQSCIVLELALPAGSVISVAARTSSQGGFDPLQIQADKLRLDTISAPALQAERGWRQQSYFLPTAISTLSWCYTKDTRANRQQDAAWIDNLSFSTSDIPYQSRICAVLDLTDNNCSLIQSISYDPPELLWVITSQTSVAGRTSLRSGAIGDGRQSCLVLEVSLPAGSVISVAGRTNSQGGFDQLQIDADRLRIDTISAPATQIERSWRQQSYFLPTAISELSWCYAKDSFSFTQFGFDAAWIDSLSFSTSNISYQSRICAALDVTASDCSLIQSIRYTPSALLWIITSQTSVAGGTSLRSGNIGDNQQSCVVLELPLPANSVISVAARTSSQGGNDQLQIQAGNLRLDTISAPMFQTERGWRQQSYFLPIAISELRWCYTKNQSFGHQQDAAWIDSLSFSTSNISYQSRVCAALDLTASDCSLIQSVTHNPPESRWIITSQTSVAGRTSMRSGYVDDNQQSCIVLEVSLPADSVISVAARTSSRGGYDELRVHADSRRLNTISGERGWRQQGYTLQAAISELSWCYVDGGQQSRGQDAVWIDALTFIATETASVCEPLDLSVDDRCAVIESVTYDPPQNRWQAMTSTASLVGASALVTPPLAAGQSACLIIELASTLPPDNQLIFSWRITSPSEQDMLRFQAGSQQRQISNEPEWQTEYIELDSLVTTLSWCYTSDNQDSRAWLDSLLLVTPADRYRVEIAIADAPVLVSAQSETFRYRVEISVESPLLPPPPDWVLLVSGIDNIVEADSTFALSFGSSGSTEVVVFSTPQNPLLPATVLLALVDRPSFSGATGTSIRYTLPAMERAQLAVLQLLVASTVTQTALDAPIEIAVAVRSADRSGRPFNPQGLTLGVAAVDNANVLQSSYALSFAGGMAQTTVTVELIRDRSTGRVEIAVTSGEINTTAAVVINPAPPQLASITLSAASSNLVQTTANTAVSAVLMLAALDNYGDPIDAGEINLQIEATNDAIVVSSLTVAIATTATAMIEILPQNDLNTTVTVSILRGTLDESVQLLPDGGIEIAVRPLRVLPQLQLLVASTVTQTTAEAPIEIAVEVRTANSFGEPFNPEGLTLGVAAVDNANVPQSSYALSFAGGMAQTTVTVELIRDRSTGRVEISVTGGEINITASVVINPAPPELASITLSAASSNLVQTVANTAVSAELILTALDNYGDPIDAAAISLQIEATNDAIVVSSLTVAIATTAMIEILPQNDLDTTLTVQLSRGTLDEAVQLLPEAGIQIAVRALRVLRQLQLSLAGAQSPLQQIDRSLPILENIRLTGLDQYGQPIAFPVVMLTATAEPTTTAVTLNPQQLSATDLQGAVTELRVVFPDDNPVETMITIAIASPGTGVTTQNLVIRALPDRRETLQSLNIDTETGVTELDLIVALRWLTDQRSSTQSLVANLTITSTSVMTAGIDNLRKLFTESDNLDRVDLNNDRRADHLDLRILLRYISGLRGSALAEQEVSEGLILLLLDQQP